MGEERHALRTHALSVNAAGCEHYRFVEQLFCEVPVMRCGPAADIGLTEERWHQHPGVADDLIALGKIERNGYIQALSDAAHPSLACPPRQQLCGSIAIKFK